MANIAKSLIGDWERITVANPGGVQGVRPTFPSIKYSMKMKWFGLDETKLFHFHRIFKIQSTKRNQYRLYIWNPFPGILDPPLHLDVYLENSLIWMIQTATLLPYGSPLFRQNKSTLSYYGSAQT